MDKKIVKVNDYVLFKKIGKGSFGEVYLTENEKTHKIYATKRIHTAILKSRDAIKYLKNEINIMKKLDHENIIKLHESLQSSNNVYLVMDYINGGSLSDFLNEYKLKNGCAFPQHIIQYFLRQIVQGLIYIHSKKIIHRDLKLDNILLNFPSNIPKESRDYSQSQIRIIDFGLSAQTDLAKSVVGTPISMDPVILNKYKKAGGKEKFKYYDKKADIWSLGVITYEMLTGQNLFKATNLAELLNKVEKGDYSLEVKDLSDEIISFLNCMLQFDPEKRLSAVELSKHQFLTGDVNSFNKSYLSEIQYKINNGVLTLNILNNSTVKKKFPFKPEVLINSLMINLNLISDKFSKQDKNSKVNLIEDKKEQRKNKLQITNDTLSKISNLDNIEVIEKNIATLNLDNATTQIISNYPINSHTTIQKTKSLGIENAKKINDDKNNNNNKITPGGYTSSKSGEIIRRMKKKEYKCKFYVSRTDNIKEDVNIKILFFVNDNNTKEHELDLTTKNNFQEEWTWKFNSNDWINIDNNNENFLMTIDVNNKQKFNLSVEKIKLGKPIGFHTTNYIIFKLTPIITEIKD